MSKQPIKERKITLRFRTKDQAFLFDYLETFCNEKGIKLNTYLLNIIHSHIEDLIKKKVVPDFTSTMYGVTRKAVYAGTIGQNVYLAKQLKPVVSDLEVLDLKINLVLNAVLGQIDPNKYEDLQNPPDKYLSDLEKFKSYRKRIENKLNSNIKTYINQTKNIDSNNTKFASAVSFEEYVNTNIDDKSMEEK